MGNTANKSQEAASSIPKLTSTAVVVDEAPEVPATPHGVMCYGARAPVAMCVGRLDGDVVEYLNDTEIFQCPQERLEDLGFKRCVDYPHLPDHVYYEGYFHSCASPESLVSLNPRNGRPFRKPPAPRPLRAFYAAFRRKNRAWLESLRARVAAMDWEADAEVPQGSGEMAMAVEMLEGLLKGSGGGEGLAEEWRKEGPKKMLARAVAELFDAEGVFGELLVGDLAVQVHCGTGVGYKSVGWHFDAINSLFHFATSVKGQRALWSSLAGEEGEAVSVSCDALSAGDVYVSSPTFFRHGVSYPEQPWERRTVAIQARFLLTRPLLRFLSRCLGPDFIETYHKLGVQIAQAMIEGLGFPSLQEVLAEEATLGEYTGELRVDHNYLDGVTNSNEMAY